MLPSSHRLWDANLAPFRISKTLLEDVLDALRLLLGVARMSLGALGPLLGCSWLALASLCLAFELVLLARLSFLAFLSDFTSIQAILGSQIELRT